jgi:hypothetical protein
MQKGAMENSAQRVLEESGADSLANLRPLGSEAEGDALVKIHRS